MKKTVVGTLVVAFMLSTTHAFAQFKGAALSAKNLKNLERVISNACHDSKKVYTVNVPYGGGKLRLTRAVVHEETPVTASLIRYRRNSIQLKWGKESTVLSASNQVLKTEYPAGRGFYGGAKRLAKDLHAFYGGKGTVWVRRDGKEVKFYALPVDGILFQPEGYAKPLVLNSDEYFVIYDIKEQTGWLAENKPSVYEAYRPKTAGKQVTYVRPASAPKQHSAKQKKSKVSKPVADHTLSWRKEAVETVPVEERTLSGEQIFQKSYQTVAQLRASGKTENWWQYDGLAKQFDTGVALGQAVAQFYDLHQANLPASIPVKKVIGDTNGSIYEIPVEGLEIQLKNGRTVVLNPEEFVLFRFKGNSFMPIKRSELTQSFKVLNH